MNAMNLGKFIAAGLVSISCTVSLAGTCGGIDSEAFNDIDLKVQTIADSDFLEEGLSFEEYPDFDIEKVKSGYEVGIGAGSFGSDEEKFKLECQSGVYVLNLYTSEGLSISIKDFEYANNKVIGASVHEVSEGKSNLVATFTENGRSVVYGSLDYFKPASPDHFLSQYINEENSSIYVQVKTDGSYHIEIGSIEVDTYLGNPGGAVAIYDPNEKILYVEIPKMNLILELNVKTEIWSEFTRVKVKAGSLDSAAPLKEVGEFMDYFDYNSEGE